MNSGGDDRVSRPRRAAAGSGRRLASGVVLLVGTVLAVAAGFGPPELVRVGVGLAVATAVLAWSAAWREVALARRQHAHQMLSAASASARLLAEERQRGAAVTAALTVQAQQANLQTERQATALAVLRGELATLRGDRAQLVTEIGHRDAAILALRDTVRAREAELVALRDDAADGAQVHALPRRVRTENGPATSDLSEVVAMIMPNYEVDLRLA